ncbi:pyridoxamine 5'-phosphate oxidase family protein [Micromonospora matsumotoense]|nr:pyridoxamine 5'-phosphate oxidase family protein [Micromonospora matsumotoense]
MGTVYPALDGRLREFVEAQPMFFVATAPSGAQGHVNVSPKGMRGTFVVLGPHRVAWLDYHGSGAETIAHLRDNGRITLMFCAFDGPPKILRLHGRGVATPVTDPGFGALLADFPEPPDLHAVRAVIGVTVERVSDSCGYAVPLMDYRGDRDLLVTSHSRRTAEDLVTYRATKNAASIDGLPVF